MAQTFDFKKLAKEIKSRREDVMEMGLREAARHIKISPTTLSRMEEGKVSEINNILKLCSWLAMPITYFIQPSKS